MKKWKGNEKEYFPFGIGVVLLIFCIHSFVDADFIGENTFRRNKKAYFTPIINLVLGVVLIYWGCKRVK